MSSSTTTHDRLHAFMSILTDLHDASTKASAFSQASASLKAFLDSTEDTTFISSLHAQKDGDRDTQSSHFKFGGWGQLIRTLMMLLGSLLKRATATVSDKSKAREVSSLLDRTTQLIHLHSKRLRMCLLPWTVGRELMSVCLRLLKPYAMDASLSTSMDATSVGVYLSKTVIRLLDSTIHPRIGNQEEIFVESWNLIKTGLVEQAKIHGKVESGINFAAIAKLTLEVWAFEPPGWLNFASDKNVIEDLFILFVSWFARLEKLDTTTTIIESDLLGALRGVVLINGRALIPLLVSGQYGKRIWNLLLYVMRKETGLAVRTLAMDCLTGLLNAHTQWITQHASKVDLWDFGNVTLLCEGMLSRRSLLGEFSVVNAATGRVADLSGHLKRLKINNEPFQLDMEVSWLNPNAFARATCRFVAEMLAGNSVESLLIAMRNAGTGSIVVGSGDGTITTPCTKFIEDRVFLIMVAYALLSPWVPTRAAAASVDAPEWGAATDEVDVSNPPLIHGVTAIVEITASYHVSGETCTTLLLELVDYLSHFKDGFEEKHRLVKFTEALWILRVMAKLAMLPKSTMPLDVWVKVWSIITTSFLPDLKQPIIATSQYSVIAARSLSMQVLALICDIIPVATRINFTREVVRGLISQSSNTSESVTTTTSSMFGSLCSSHVFFLSRCNLDDADRAMLVDWLLHAWNQMSLVKKQNASDEGNLAVRVDKIVGSYQLEYDLFTTALMALLGIAPSNNVVVPLDTNDETKLRFFRNPLSISNPSLGTVVTHNENYATAAAVTSTMAVIRNVVTDCLANNEGEDAACRALSLALLLSCTCTVIRGRDLSVGKMLTLFVIKLVTKAEIARYSRMPQQHQLKPYDVAMIRDLMLLSSQKCGIPLESSIQRSMYDWAMELLDYVLQLVGPQEEEEEEQQPTQKQVSKRTTSANKPAYDDDDDDFDADEWFDGPGATTTTTKRLKHSQQSSGSSAAATRTTTTTTSKTTPKQFPTTSSDVLLDPYLVTYLVSLTTNMMQHTNERREEHCKVLVERLDVLLAWYGESSQISLQTLLTILDAIVTMGKLDQGGHATVLALHAISHVCEACKADILAVETCVHHVETIVMILMGHIPDDAFGSSCGQLVMDFLSRKKFFFTLKADETTTKGRTRMQLRDKIKDGTVLTRPMRLGLLQICRFFLANMESSSSAILHQLQEFSQHAMKENLFHACPTVREHVALYLPQILVNVDNGKMHLELLHELCAAAPRVAVGGAPVVLPLVDGVIESAFAHHRPPSTNTNMADEIRTFLLALCELAATSPRYLFRPVLFRVCLSSRRAILTDKLFRALSHTLALTYGYESVKDMLRSQSQFLIECWLDVYPAICAASSASSIAEEDGSATTIPVRVLKDFPFHLFGVTSEQEFYCATLPVLLPCLFLSRNMSPSHNALAVLYHIAKLVYPTISTQKRAMEDMLQDHVGVALGIFFPLTAAAEDYDIVGEPYCDRAFVTDVIMRYTALSGNPKLFTGLNVLAVQVGVRKVLDLLCLDGDAFGVSAMITPQVAHVFLKSTSKNDDENEDTGRLLVVVGGVEIVMHLAAKLSMAVIQSHRRKIIFVACHVVDWFTTHLSTQTAALRAFVHLALDVLADITLVEDGTRLLRKIVQSVSSDAFQPFVELTASMLTSLMEKHPTVYGQANNVLQIFDTFPGVIRAGATSLIDLAHIVVNEYSSLQTAFRINIAPKRTVPRCLARLDALIVAFKTSPDLSLLVDPHLLDVSVRELEPSAVQEALVPGIRFGQSQNTVMHPQTITTKDKDLTRNLIDTLLHLCGPDFPEPIRERAGKALSELVLCVGDPRSLDTSGASSCVTSSWVSMGFASVTDLDSLRAEMDDLLPVKVEILKWLSEMLLHDKTATLGTCAVAVLKAIMHRGSSAQTALEALEQQDHNLATMLRGMFPDLDGELSSSEPPEGPAAEAVRDARARHGGNIKPVVTTRRRRSSRPPTPLGLANHADETNGLDESVWTAANENHDAWVCRVCDHLCRDPHVIDDDILRLCGPVCVLEPRLASMLFPWLVYSCIDKGSADVNQTLSQTFTNLLESPQTEMRTLHMLLDTLSFLRGRSIRQSIKSSMWSKGLKSAGGGGGGADSAAVNSRVSDHDGGGGTKKKARLLPTSATTTTTTVPPIPPPPPPRHGASPPPPRGDYRTFCGLNVDLKLVANVALRVSSPAAAVLNAELALEFEPGGAPSVSMNFSDNIAIMQHSVGVLDSQMMMAETEDEMTLPKVESAAAKDKVNDLVRTLREMPYNYNVLLRAYRCLGDQDAAEGVQSTLASLPNRVQEQAYKGDFLGALVGYDALLTTWHHHNDDGDDNTEKQRYETGAAVALSRLGLIDTLRRFLSNSASSSSSELGAEAEWRLAAVNPQGPSPQHMHDNPILAGFHALRSGDGTEFQSQYRRELPGLLDAISRRSPETFLKDVVKLRCLVELQDALGPSVTSSNGEGNVFQQVTQWDTRMSKATTLDFHLVDELNMAREGMLRAIIGRGGGGANTTTFHHLISTAELARKRGKAAFAASALDRLMRDKAIPVLETELGPVDTIKIVLQQARVMWAFGDTAQAIVIATRVVKVLEGLTTLEARYLLPAARCLAGIFLAQSSSSQSSTVVKKELETAVRDCENLVNTLSTITDESSSGSAMTQKAIRLLGQNHGVVASFVHRQFRGVVSRLASPEWKKVMAIHAHRQEELQGYKARAMAKGADATVRMQLRGVIVRLEKECMHDEKEKLQVLQAHDELAKIALRHYLCALAYNTTSEELDVSVYRVVGLWFDCAKVLGVNDMMARAFGTSRRSSTPSLSSSSSVVVPIVPSFKLIPLMYQCVSRVGSQMESNDVPSSSNNTNNFKDTLESILCRLVTEHPWHALPHLLALINAKRLPSDDPMFAVTEDVKVDAAHKLYMRVKKSNAAMERIYDHMSNLYEAFIHLAYYQSPGGDKDERHRRLHHSTDECTEYKTRMRNMTDLSSLPIPATTVSVLPEHTYKAGRDFIGIAEISKRFTITEQGISAPKVIEVVGMDGVIRRILVKGKDDLRQDGVMEQLLVFVSHLLQSDPSTRKKKMRLRTYNVVPLTPAAGLIEWVENTTSLGTYLYGGPIHDHKYSAHVRHNPGDMSFNEAMHTLKHEHDKATGGDAKSVFQHILQRFRPAFRHFFIEHYGADPMEWYEKRLAYTRSTAANSMAGMVLGIGDRHSQNILLDKRTGEVIHIDFGVAFEQGRVLKTPETVPFRLTQDVIDGMGVTGVNGVFMKACEETLTVLRENADAILTICEVFVHDPLHRWAVALNRQQQVASDTLQQQQQQQQQQRQQPLSMAAPAVSDTSNMSTSMSTNVVVNVEAERVLARLRQKLQGVVSADDSYALDVAAQVKRCISEATDVNLLCRMFAGWAPFL